jgi:hypothetical protein
LLHCPAVNSIIHLAEEKVALPTTAGETLAEEKLPVKKKVKAQSEKTKRFPSLLKAGGIRRVGELSRYATRATLDAFTRA